MGIWISVAFDQSLGARWSAQAQIAMKFQKAEWKVDRNRNMLIDKKEKKTKKNTDSAIDSDSA